MKKPTPTVKALQRIAVALEKINNRSEMAERALLSILQFFLPTQQEEKIKGAMKAVINEMKRKKK